MQEIAPNIHYVPGKNKSRFPYCACLYLAGSHDRVLIDAGMGASHLSPVKQAGIDWLFFTHCHIDHRLTRRVIPEVPVACHAREEPYFTDSALFHSALGFERSGLDLSWMYKTDPKLFDMKVSRRITDGERIDIGGLTLEAVLTPGHSPGHLCFFIPEYELLFSGDLDLTAFGPFYGHDFADIDALFASIDRARQIGAKTVVSGHAGPFTEDIEERFDAFKAVIEKREEAVLNHLGRPRTLPELVGHGIIFRRFYDQSPYGGLNRWFEQVHIEKHLHRLAAMGEARYDPETGRWHRLS